MTALTTDTAKALALALAEIEGLGLEDVKPTAIQRKYISLDKDSGLITIDKGQTLLADNKKQCKITPIFTYETWDYISLDGMQTYKRDLIHEKNHNLTLIEEAVVAVDGQDAKRAKGRTVLVLVQDHEAFGPMLLTLRRQKLWNATVLLSKWLENKAKKTPIFGQSFLLSSEQKTNKKNQKFYVYKFAPGDITVDVDKLIPLAAMYKELRDSQDRLLQQAEDESGSAHE